MAKTVSNQPKVANLLQDQAVNRAVAMLTGVGCSFTIITPDGAKIEHGAKTSAKDKAEKAAYRAWKAEVAKVITELNLDSLINSTAVGGVIKLDLSAYDKKIRERIRSQVLHGFGAGNGMTTIDAKTGAFEAIRVS